MKKQVQQAITFIKEGTHLRIRGRLGSGTSGKWRDAYANQDFNINQVQRLPLHVKGEGKDIYTYYDFFPLVKRVKIRLVKDDGTEVIIKDEF